MIDIGDDLQVQFFGPAPINGDFDEAEAGRYALSFVPPKPGDYEVHVMLQTVHVPGANPSVDADVWELTTSRQPVQPEGGSEQLLGIAIDVNSIHVYCTYGQNWPKKAGQEPILYRVGWLLSTLPDDRFRIWNASDARRERRIWDIMLRWSLLTDSCDKDQLRCQRWEKIAEKVR